MTFVPFAQNTREEVRIIGDGKIAAAISSETGTHQQTFVAFRGNNTSGPIEIATTCTAHGSGRLDFESETFVTHTLCGDGFDASEDGPGRGTPLIPNYAGVRRLMPVECERLQGFPDGWTEGQADSTRYRQLGNAVSVPVAEWIGKRIVEASK